MSQPSRYVNVDLGYQTNEDWVRARVISTIMAKDLWEPRTFTERLLVEIPGGERIMVSYWTEEEI